MKQLIIALVPRIKQDYHRKGWLARPHFGLNPANLTLRVIFHQIAAMIRLYLGVVVLSWMFFSPDALALCMDGQTARCTLNGKSGTKTCDGGRWSTCQVSDPDEPVDPTPHPPHPPQPPEPALYYYFGDLHSHTRFSDGSSDIVHSFTATLNKIRDSGVDPKINFMAITDHAGSLSADEFDKILQNASNTYPGIRFVGIPGFELDRWGGHENLFAVESNGVVYAGDYPGGWWESLWPLEWYVRNHNNIVQLNHPGGRYRDGSLMNFNDFRQPDQSKVFDQVALIEIADTGEENWESQFVRALDRGWHVAPTINSDWHGANMGERWDSERRTAVVTTSSALTREVIYSAMRERRTYATEDKNLEIDFRINDRQMGSILSTADNKLRITIVVRDPDPGDRIDRIELYSNNGVLLTRIDYGQGPEYLTSFDWPFLNVPGRYYFFMKVYQGDGQRAWTAPIRVDKQ